MGLDKKTETLNNPEYPEKMRDVWVQKEPAYIGAMGSFPDGLPVLLLVGRGNGWKWELL